MKLKKCRNCEKYTFKENCDVCKNLTNEAHYKFIKIKDAPKSGKKTPKPKNEIAI